MSKQYLLLLLILCSQLLIGQEDTLRTQTKFTNICLGIEVFEPNYSGEIRNADFQLSNDSKDALRKLSSNIGLGFRIFGEKPLRRNNNIRFRPEIGLRFSSGTIDFETVLGQEKDSLIEDRYSYDFKHMYLNNAYLIDFRFNKLKNLGFIIGSRAALRLSNKAMGKKIRSIVDYNENPIFRFLWMEEDINTDVLLLSVQLNIEFGINYTLKLKERNELMFEIGYQYPLLKLYSPVNLKSNPIGFSVIYKYYRNDK